MESLAAGFDQYFFAGQPAGLGQTPAFNRGFLQRLEEPRGLSMEDTLRLQLF